MVPTSSVPPVISKSTLVVTGEMTDPSMKSVRSACVNVARGAVT